MSRDASLFTTLEWKDGGYVKFGDNSKVKIIATGIVGFPLTTIKNISLVRGLKHNLLSISQLCDKGYKMTFGKDKEEAFNQDGEKIFEGFQKGNIYMIEPAKVETESCFLTMHDNIFLWHKKLGHVNFSQLENLLKKNLLHVLLRIFIKNAVKCDTCLKNKMVSVSHK